MKNQDLILLFLNFSFLNILEAAESEMSKFGKKHFREFIGLGILQPKPSGFITPSISATTLPPEETIDELGNHRKTNDIAIITNDDKIFFIDENLAKLSQPIANITLAEIDNPHKNYVIETINSEKFKLLYEELKKASESETAWTPQSIWLTLSLDNLITAANLADEWDIVNRQGDSILPNILNALTPFALKVLDGKEEEKNLLSELASPLQLMLLKKIFPETLKKIKKNLPLYRLKVNLPTDLPKEPDEFVADKDFFYTNDYAINQKNELSFTYAAKTLDFDFTDVFIKLPRKQIMRYRIDSNIHRLYFNQTATVVYATFHNIIWRLDPLNKENNQRTSLPSPIMYLSTDLNERIGIALLDGKIIIDKWQSQDTWQKEKNTFQLNNPEALSIALRRQVISIAFGQKNPDLFAVILGDSLSIWNYNDNKKPIRDWYYEKIYDVVFTNDDEWLVAAGSSTIYIIESSTGETLIEHDFGERIGLKHLPPHDILIHTKNSFFKLDIDQMNKQIQEMNVDSFDALWDIVHPRPQNFLTRLQTFFMRKA